MCAVLYYAMDWTHLGLIKLFKETGRSPSSILAFTPNELRYVCRIRDEKPKEEHDRMLLTARGHTRWNHKRAIDGLPPKIVDELRMRIEGKA